MRVLKYFLFVSIIIFSFFFSALLPFAHAQYDSGDIAGQEAVENTPSPLPESEPTPEVTAIRADLAAKRAAAAASTGCSWWPSDWGKCLADGINYLLLALAGWILWLGGLLLEFSLRFNICEFSSFVNGDNGSMVMAAWQIVRNVANFFFIFILLYIAISVILNIGSDQKKLIVWVVIIALLINFSAVLTRVVIDASNVFAYQFYSKLTNGQACTNDQKTGISDEFMYALGLQSFAQSTAEERDAVSQEATSIFENLTGTQALLAGILLFVILLITAWTFIIAGVLLFLRSVLLIFLIILSPVAFMGFIFPGKKEWWSTWWKTLTDQAIFAPVYLFFVMITVIILRGSAQYMATMKSGGTAYF